MQEIKSTVWFFQQKKSLKEHGDKVSAEEKTIENGINELKESLKGTNIEDIKEKNTKLNSSINEVRRSCL